MLYLISVSKGTHQAGSADQIGSADQSDSSLQKGEVDPQQFLPYYNQPELQTSQKLRDYKNYPYLQEIFEEIRIYDKSLLVDDFPENFYEKVVLNYYISKITNNEELLEYLFMENTPQHRDYLAVDDDEKFFDSGSVKRIVIKQVEAFIDIEEINQEFDILSDQVHINFPGYKTKEELLKEMGISEYVLVKVKFFYSSYLSPVQYDDGERLDYFVLRKDPNQIKNMLQKRRDFV